MGYELQMPIVWLIIFAAMVVIELLTMGLTTIWFAGGALVALFVSMARIGILLQIVLFILVSLGLLVLIRPWARTHFNHQRIRTNAQSLIGENAIVIEDINNMKAEGRVMVQGQEWAARSAKESQLISKDTQVRILEISGVKLIVETIGDM